MNSARTGNSLRAACVATALSVASTAHAQVRVERQQRWSTPRDRRRPNELHASFVPTFAIGDSTPNRSGALWGYSLAHTFRGAITYGRVVRRQFLVGATTSFAGAYGGFARFDGAQLRYYWVSVGAIAALRSDSTRDGPVRAGALLRADAELLIALASLRGELGAGPGVRLGARFGVELVIRSFVASASAGFEWLTYSAGGFGAHMIFGPTIPVEVGYRW